MREDSRSSPQSVQSSGALADNILYFARALRSAGLPVGPGAVLDALAAVDVAGISGRQDFYWTLHAIFVNRREQSVVFDQVFHLFFRKRGLFDAYEITVPEALPAEPSPPQPGAQRAHEALFSGARSQDRERTDVEIDMRSTMSDREVLRKKDFAQMSAEDIADARKAIARLRLPLDRVKTRRLVPRRRGQLLDFRRTMRASMAAGGSLIDLKYLGSKTTEPPIVALLDISGSMSQYSRQFLHFLHAVTDARKRVSTFLFGTRLTNITRALRHRDPDEALMACASLAPDWSGGTRIATSLHDFNKHWGRRVLGQGAVVLLITDGLERESDDRLAFEMDRLHRSCRRLIWLNPLLRFDRFEARARGVRTILPHVDELRPIHNLESMAALVQALSGTDAGFRDPKFHDPKRWLIQAA